MNLFAYIWFEFAWIIELFLFLILIVASNFFLTRLFKRFKRHYSEQKSDWRYNLDYAILAPLQTLLWILFVAFVIDLVAREFELKQIMIDPIPIRNAGVVICITWFFFRWKKLFEQSVFARRQAGKKTLDPASMEIFGKIYTIVVLILAVLVLLQNFGLNIAPFLAFGGIGAAAIGFASKDMIANYFGGMTIYLSKPFTVGDMIEIPQKNLTGNIEKIGWYFTTLRDFSMRPHYIPNAVFTTELVVNTSRISHRHIEEKLCLRYSDFSKLDALTQEIRQFLSSHKKIDFKQPIYVHIFKFAESAIELEIRSYTKATQYGEYMSVKQEILIQICEILKRHGTEVSHPIQEVFLHRGQ